MKKYSKKYCPHCGKMNTIDPERAHKKCKFCGGFLTPPIAFYFPPPVHVPVDPDHDNDDDSSPSTDTDHEI